MNRPTIPSTKSAPAAAQPLLAAVAKSLGSVPNLFRLAAVSPAALEGLVGLNGALGKALDARLREGIALAVAQVNGCDYCLAAHSDPALNLAKLDGDDIELARRGHASDAKTDAALVFAAKVAAARGKVAQADLAAVKLAGFGDAQVVEIVALVALNFFTNLLNNVAQTPVDFPAAPALKAA
jgi:uncharacterized peroxidase-related enzyme